MWPFKNKNKWRREGRNEILWSVFSDASQAIDTLQGWSSGVYCVTPLATSDGRYGATVEFRVHTRDPKSEYYMVGGFLFEEEFITPVNVAMFRAMRNHDFRPASIFSERRDDGDKILSCQFVKATRDYHLSQNELTHIVEDRIVEGSDGVWHLCFLMDDGTVKPLDGVKGFRDSQDAFDYSLDHGLDPYSRLAKIDDLIQFHDVVKEAE